MSSEQQSGIYLGSRGDDFKDLIISVLKKGGIREKYINILTNDDSMQMYMNAFTSETVDPVNNYQVLEMVGDVSGNKFIVNYMYARFPQLDCTDGLKVVARLRINYGAKESFCEIARKLGFWKFISATNDIRQRKMKPLLEDVFEAFLGATERIIDRYSKLAGVGYAIVHKILSAIFNEMHISLRYEDLYDSKTRLKELFDLHEKQIGPLVYKERKSDQITFSTAFRVHGGKYEEKIDAHGNVTVNKKRIIGGNYIKIGEGSAALKADAQQNAAASALKTLKRQGWVKPVPEIYQRFNKGLEDQDNKDEELTVVDIEKLWGNDMNVLQTTKDKTKYQNKYQSTPLALYCRTRNISGIASCLNMEADPNIADSEGMFPVDLLFIGKTDESLVKEIMILLFSCSDNLNMHRPVFQLYFTGYVGEYFKDVVSKLTLID